MLKNFNVEHFFDKTDILRNMTSNKLYQYENKPKGKGGEKGVASIRKNSYEIPL